MGRRVRCRRHRCALLILALKVGNLGSFGGAETYQVSAPVRPTSAASNGAPVKSAGVVVGRVADIRFDNEKFVAAVTMNIDKRYKFPKDTLGVDPDPGLLGEQYVGLEGGGDDAMLKNGDTIKLTQSAVVLEKLIGQFLYSKAAEGGAPTNNNRGSAHERECNDQY